MNPIIDELEKPYMEKEVPDDVGLSRSGFIQRYWITL